MDAFQPYDRFNQPAVQNFGTCDVCKKPLTLDDQDAESGTMFSRHLSVNHPCRQAQIRAAKQLATDIVQGLNTGK